MLPSSLSNFEAPRCYKNGPRFNGIYSKNNLLVNIKDAVYVKNLNEYSEAIKNFIGGTILYQRHIE